MINIFGPSGQLIPSRSSFTSGSEFISSMRGVKGQKREDAILAECLAGNIPNFLRNFKPLTITSGSNSITYLVMSDYLSVGSDEDFCRMPMNVLTGQKIADKYDCSLPTKKIVDDIDLHAEIKLIAKPWGEPYKNMDLTERFPVQNEKINKQLVGLDYTRLVSGHAKDEILTNKLSPNNPNKRVCIYGWRLSNRSVIQGANAKDHSVDYMDYSQNVRLIANDVIVNGSIMRLQDVFTNANYASLVSDEGVLKFTRY